MAKQKLLLYYNVMGKPFIESHPCKTIELAREKAARSKAKAAEFLSNGKRTQIK
ncbi:MAG: hypothetical protein ACYDHY_19165 [Acidiferrobacterales bacterium]